MNLFSDDEASSPSNGTIMVHDGRSAVPSDSAEEDEFVASGAQMVFDQLYHTTAPRDVLTGTGAGVMNVVRGTGAGMAACCAVPVAGGMAGGYPGAVGGALAGFVAGCALAGTGAVTGGMQMAQGLVQTPSSMYRSWRGQEWVEVVKPQGVGAEQ